MQAASSTAGCLYEHAFDFDRGNVLAARDNQVFLAIDDLDHSFAVDRRHIARVEPAIDDDGAGRLLLAPVAGHHHVAARDDFADALAIGFDVLSILVHDAQSTPSIRYPVRV